MEGVVKFIVEQLERNGDISISEARDLLINLDNRSAEDFDDFLLSEGLVSKAKLLNALSQVYDVPYFDVVGYFFDHDLLQHFPEDFLFANNIIPIQQDGDVLTIVASEPDNPKLRESISEYSNSAIEFRVGLTRDIQDAIREYYDSSITEDFVAEDEDIFETPSKLIQEDEDSYE